MRSINFHDIDSLARYVAPLEPDDRLPAINRALERASYADAFRKRHGRQHVDFGNGSVQQAVCGRLREYAANDPAYLRSLALVCEVFADRADRHIKGKAA